MRGFVGAKPGHLPFCEAARFAFCELEGLFLAAQAHEVGGGLLVAERFEWQGVGIESGIEQALGFFQEAAVPHEIEARIDFFVALLFGAPASDAENVVALLGKAVLALGLAQAQAREGVVLKGALDANPITGADFGRGYGVDLFKSSEECLLSEGAALLS